MKKTVEQRFWANVNKRGTVPAHMKHLGRCWEWLGKRDRKGYPVFCAGGERHKGHRFSFQLFKGPIIKECVCHKCDNPSCCNPRHLWNGTREENVADMVKKGRQARGLKINCFGFGEMVSGENSGNAKLTEADILKIRKIYVPGKITQEEIGKRYGVNKTTIRRAVSGESWKYTPFPK